MSDTTKTTTSTTVIELNDDKRNAVLTEGETVKVTVGGVDIVDETVPANKVWSTSINFIATEEDA